MHRLYCSQSTLKGDISHKNAAKSMSRGTSFIYPMDVGANAVRVHISINTLDGGPFPDSSLKNERVIHSHFPLLCVLHARAVQLYARLRYNTLS